MSETINDGGPAFPYHPKAHFCCDDERKAMSGMTLRDYFAAKAFEQWVCAHIHQAVDDLDKNEVATQAYQYADAMLAARERKP